MSFGEREVEDEVEVEEEERAARCELEQGRLSKKLTRRLSPAPYASLRASEIGAACLAALGEALK